jgi:chemotaxis protein methyltransferase CheR
MDRSAVDMTFLNSAERRREFEFTERDFQTVRKLIYARAGINLKAGKQEMVYSRLARRLRALKLESFRSYLALLEDDDASEWEAFINAITTNLTHFFREPHHFDILARQYRDSEANHPFRVWSAASSTGEEVYSIAMTLAEADDGGTPQPNILASDLDTNVLEQARRGIYSVERLENVSLERRKRFFLRGTSQHEGYVKIREEIRRSVRFEHINLMSPNWEIKELFDAIFCRNVMIYFDKETQYSILKRLSQVLRPTGYLYVGHSENLFHAKDLYQLCDKTVYRLVQSAPLSDT